MEEKNIETYKLPATCTNCGYTGTIEFSLGVEKYTKRCPSCGCTTLSPEKATNVPLPPIRWRGNGRDEIFTKNHDKEAN